MTDVPTASPDAPAPTTTMRRDISSAYALTLARIGSWVVVSAVVFRLLGAEAFAMVALVRATVGLLSYVSLGVGPALVRLLSVAEHLPESATPRAVPIETPPATPGAPVLNYATAHEPPPPADAVTRTYVTGEIVSVALGFVGAFLTTVYVSLYPTLHEVPRPMEGAVRALVILFGLGIVCRVVSEAPAALLQVRRRIALDNALAAGAELIWAVGSVAFLLAERARPAIEFVGVWFLAAQVFLLCARAVAGRSEARGLTGVGVRVDRSIALQLLSYGALVTLAQLGDFLYAPVDYILINRLISPEAVAVYAPAVQIDAALLLSVTAVAAVLLPKAALAHAAGDVASVRRYYVRGTLATAAMLAAGAVVAWALSPWVFRLWLGEPMLATRALLPLVLVHTVVGGSGAVGRSILIGMGKVRPFTISVVLAGVGNVVLSYLFVRMGLGLKGIVLGTIVVVTLRAGVWMPWYVMRAIREEGGRRKDETERTSNIQR